MCTYEYTLFATCGHTIKTQVHCQYHHHALKKPCPATNPQRDPAALSSESLSPSSSITTAYPSSRSSSSTADDERSLPPLPPPPPPPPKQEPFSVFPAPPYRCGTWYLRPRPLLETTSARGPRLCKQGSCEHCLHVQKVRKVERNTTDWERLRQVELETREVEESLQDLKEGEGVEREATRAEVGEMKGMGGRRRGLGWWGTRLWRLAAGGGTVGYWTGEGEDEEEEEEEEEEEVGEDVCVDGPENGGELVETSLSAFEVACSVRLPTTSSASSSSSEDSDESGDSSGTDDDGEGEGEQDLTEEEMSLLDFSFLTRL